MSVSAGIITSHNRTSLFFDRLRVFFLLHPEWRTWGLSLLVWSWLATELFTGPQATSNAHTIIYCTPDGTNWIVENPANDSSLRAVEPGLFATMIATIPVNLFHWLIMVVAMMFPLLNEPVRHTAFSVRRKARNGAIASFLTGYTISWAIAGLLFVLFSSLLQIVMKGQPAFVNASISASGFLLAAFFSLRSSRPVIMMKCIRTMPIRIDGWRMHLDGLLYGVKMGITCLAMCWPVMTALMIAGHDIILMYAVTILLLIERYLLPHTSRLPGYAWVAIAILLFYSNVGL